MIRFKAFVVMILACTLFILIYLQSHLSNRQQHLQILSKLQKIDKNSTLLNQRLLKTHQGLLRHYDDVLATINKLKHLNSYLKNQQLGFKHQQSQFELLQKKNNSTGNSH